MSSEVNVTQSVYLETPSKNMDDNTLAANLKTLRDAQVECPIRFRWMLLNRAVDNCDVADLVQMTLPCRTLGRRHVCFVYPCYGQGGRLGYTEVTSLVTARVNVSCGDVSCFVSPTCLTSR